MGRQSTEKSAIETFSVTTGALPASRKVYIEGDVHPQIRVAMREIDLSEGANEPALRVYDASGAYTDPQATIDIHHGLAEIRRDWIVSRGDVEAYQGRDIKPEDNGLKPNETGKLDAVFNRASRAPLRAKGAARPTQLAYARAGIITPEMEYVAIRENLGRAKLAEKLARDGESFGADIPDEVTGGRLFPPTSIIRNWNR